MTARKFFTALTVFGLSGILLVHSGCSGTSTKPSADVGAARVQSGQAQVREEAIGYTPEWKQEFLGDCRKSCKADTNHPKQDVQMAQVCELYCDCTHSNLKAGVPFEDLNAYGQGRINSSWARIEQIRQQCAKDSRTAVSIPVNQPL